MNSRENDLIFESYKRGLERTIISEKHKPGCTCKFCKMIQARKKKGKGKKKGKKENKKKEVIKEAEEITAPPVTPEPPKEKSWYDWSPEEWEEFDKETPPDIELSPEQLDGAKKVAIEFGKELARKDGWSDQEVAAFTKEIEGARTGTELASKMYIWAGEEGLERTPKLVPDESEGEVGEGEFEQEPGVPLPPPSSVNAGATPRR